MRIRMTTFHTPKNYGAVLQAYSLMSYLKRKCDDVKIIDFNTTHLQSLYPIIPRITGVRSLANVVLSSPRYPSKAKKYAKFDSFVQNKLDLTKRFASFEELASEPWDNDAVFVTGSDQVFNPNRIEEERKAFYLTFVPQENFKFSYAGSFGISSIPEEKRSFVKSSLESFNELSVRETSGVSIAKDLLEKRVEETLDPVFLNDSAFWKKTSAPYRKKFEKYALYYRLMNSSQSDRVAEEIARRRGLQLVVVTDNRRKGLKASKILRDVGPEELLSLFDRSDYVVTDSFHGVAFSLIFEKRFEFVDYNPKLGVRGLNLLKKVGLEEIAFHQGKWKYQDFNYSQINERLTELKKNSVHFLDAALEKAQSYIAARNHDANRND